MVAAKMTAAAAAALSEQDVAAARAELTGGRPVTVWFTPAAVGVPVGGSAKIVSVGEVAEGDYIQVRPTGSRDTMFCSPGELTRTRPARKQARVPVAEPLGVEVPVVEVPGAKVPGAKVPVAEVPLARAQVAVAQPSPDPEPATPGHTPDPAPSREKGEEARPRSTGRAAVRPAEVSVTLSATGDGEWTVEVMVGKKRTVRPTPVQPGDVAVAARALPPAVAEAIASSLDAARRRRAEQVERLRAELDAAERALKQLNG